MGFSYDALSRRLTEVLPQGTVTSTYDLADRRTQLTYPGTGLFVNTDYLVTGEVQKIRENGAMSGIGVLATYAYDNLGNRTGVTYGNGTSTAYVYDPVSRLTSLTNNLSGTASDLTIGSIGYNPASQITSQTRSNDAYAWTGHGNGSTATVTNGLNALVTVGGTAAAYSTKGDLTTDPVTGTTFTYNSQSRMTNAGSTHFTDDAFDRLYSVVGTSTVRFAYDGADAIAEYNGSDVLQKRYVFGPGTDEPIVQYDAAGTRSWMTADERGSIVALANDSGTATAMDTYDEYGNPGAANSGRFQYTGQMWIFGAKLYNDKARFYAPHLGLFMQTDPIGQASGPNLYAYVDDDPVNLVDPFGLTPCVAGSICGHCDPGTHAVEDPGTPAGVRCVLDAPKPIENQVDPRPGGSGPGGIVASLPQPPQPKPKSTCQKLLGAANALENAGGKIQDFGAGASAAGFTGDLIALAFPPAEIGTGSLTAAGGLITLFGTGVSAAGSGLNFVATHDIGRVALSGVGLVAGKLKASNEAHEFLRGLNIGKATDTAKALMPSRCP